MKNGEYYLNYTGIKWRFNPFPSKIRDVCLNVLNMFVALSHFAIELISDTTPPIVDNISIQYDSGDRALIEVRAYDDESGIHYVSITVFNESCRVSKLFYQDMDTDSWWVNISLFGDYVIKVVNRAGLKYINSTIPMIKILAPREGGFVSSHNVTVEWIVQDESMIDHFELYADDSPIDTAIPKDVFSYNLSLMDGHHIVNVTCILTNGSAYSDKVGFYVDTVPPDIDILSPSNNSVVLQEFTVTWEGTDNIGIDHYEYYVDSGTWIDVGVSNNVTLNIDTSGMHTILIKVIDHAGLSRSKKLIVFVDISPPEINVSAPINNSYVLGPQVRISWQGDDDIGIEHYEILLDSGDWIDIGNNTVYDALFYVSGQHIVLIKAVDYVGRSTMVKIVVIVDNEDPVLLLVSPQNNTNTTNTSIKIVWEASDDVDIDHYEVRINNGEWINVGLSTQYILNVSAPGKYNIYIKAIDMAGREKTILVVINIEEVTTTTMTTTTTSAPPQTPTETTTPFTLPLLTYYLPMAIILSLLIIGAVILMRKRASERI